MTVVPLPPRAAWLRDAREAGRALRVSWHAERGCAVVSTWRDGVCTGTARLTPTEVAELVAVLTAGLAEAAAAAAAASTSPGAADPLAAPPAVLPLPARDASGA